MDETLSRRDFLNQCMGGACVAASSISSQIKNVDRPNFLLVLTDNQSWLHCGAMGDPIVKTPGFDSVATSGVLFRYAFAPSPSCTPSRSALLTGQDMWRLGEAGVLHGGFPAELPVFTDLLRDAGYLVGYTGKGWGPGRWNSHGRIVDPVGTAFNKHTVAGTASGIASLDYAKNFEDFLASRGKGQPFFFWFGAREPHRPFPRGLGLQQSKKLSDVPLPAFLPDVETIRSDFLDYYVEIEWLDQHIERMIHYLKQIDEYDNTFIVITSDNGIQMPRGITTLYDYGVRVPLAMAWGKRIRYGDVMDAVVNLIDLAPTFLEVAGIEIPPAMTGRSLMGLLWGKDEGTLYDFTVTGIERHTLCRPGGLPYPSRAIRTHEFLYIRNYEPDRWPAGAPDYKSIPQGYYGDVDRSPTKTWMLEHAENPNVGDVFTLCFGKRPGEELYHVPTDPDQIHNLAQNPAYQEAKAQLAIKLDAYLKKTQDPRSNGQSPWDAYPYYSIEKEL